MKDKIITEITSECIKFLSIEDCKKVREIIEGKLYNYTLQSQTTDLVPINHNHKLLEYFLSSKIIDGCAKRTIQSYMLQLNQFLKYIQKDICEVQTIDIRMYLGIRKKTGIKDSTLSTIISTLKSFYKWLQMEEYIIKNPVDKIKSIKINKYVRNPLTLEELELLRCSCKSLKSSALLEVYYSTGCRLDEVVKLNKTDIDWNNGKITVSGKGNKIRNVYLNAKAKVHLYNYLQSRKDNNPALFTTDRKVNNGDVGRLGRRSVERLFHNLGIQAGIKEPVFVHRIRHTTATVMLNNGATLSEVQMYLGHSSPSTTMIYSKLNDEAIQNSHRKNVI